MNSNRLNPSARGALALLASNLAAALLVIAVALAWPAHAGEPPAGRSVSVSYSELDLARPEGARALLRRLSAAARQVCEVGSARGLTELLAARECYDQTLASAVARVNRAQLSAVYVAAHAPAAAG